MSQRRSARAVYDARPTIEGAGVRLRRGCETAPIEPEHAGWVEAMGEWMMSYDTVRRCDDPRQAILDFLTSVYRVAVTQGGWDAEQLAYTIPPAAKRV